METIEIVNGNDVRIIQVSGILETGRPGPKGDPGPEGPQGPAGEQGAEGPAGPAGKDGADGAPGEQGPEGPAGPAGPKGDTGPQGPAGADGKSLTILGFYETAADLEKAHPTGNPGDAYLVGHPGHLYTWNGTAWTDAGEIQGPKGDKGDTGAAGPKGDTGATGADGAQGPKGDTGNQGPAGPAGEKGATGDRGPAGEQGPAGADGKEGPAGPKGDTGPAGPAGKDSTVPGPKGDTGPVGPKGDTGPAGVVNATTPIKYDAGTQTVSADIDWLDARYSGGGGDSKRTVKRLTTNEYVLTAADLNVFLVGSDTLDSTVVLNDSVPVGTTVVMVRGKGLMDIDAEPNTAIHWPDPAKTYIQDAWTQATVTRIGTREWVVTGVFSIVPVIPTDPVYDSVTIDKNSAVLKWHAGDHAATYTLDVVEKPSGNKWPSVTGIDGLAREYTYKEKTFIEGNQYVFTLTGVNAKGSSTPVSKTVMVEKVPPAKPEHFGSAATYTYINVQWRPGPTSTTPTTGFVLVHRVTGATTWNRSSQYTPTSTEGRISDLQPDTTYDFAIIAIGDNGAEAMSDIKTIKTITPDYRPNTPTVTGTNDTYLGIDVTVGNKGDRSYAKPLTVVSINWRLKGDTAWTVKDLVSPFTSGKITGLNDGATYEIMAKAVNAAGSVESDIQTIDMGWNYPNKPKIIAASNAFDWINVQWVTDTKSTKPTSRFKVEYRVKGDTSWSVASDKIDVTSTNYKITGLTPSTTYELRVTAVAADTRGTVSDTYEKATGDAPTDPSSQKLEVTSTTARFIYVSVTDSHDHQYAKPTTVVRIMYRKKGDSSWLAKDITSQYKDPTTTYSMTVDNGGKETVWELKAQVGNPSGTVESPVVEATTPAPQIPEPPKNVKLTYTGDSTNPFMCTVSFDGYSGDPEDPHAPTGWQVFGYIDGVAAVGPANLKTSQTQYQFDAKKGGSLRVTVAGGNGDGYSATAEATMNPFPPVATEAPVLKNINPVNELDGKAFFTYGGN